MSGKFVKVEGLRITLSTDVDSIIKESATIERDGKPAKLEELQPGDTVILGREEGLPNEPVTSVIGTSLKGDSCATEGR